MNFDGVEFEYVGRLDVVSARERGGRRVRRGWEEVRVGQDLGCVSWGSVGWRGVSSCGCVRLELQVEASGGKGEYVVRGRRGRGVGDEWFCRRAARRASDLLRSREPSGPLREGRFEDAKFRL